MIKGINAAHDRRPAASDQGKDISTSGYENKGIPLLDDRNKKQAFCGPSHSLLLGCVGAQE